MNLYLKIRLIDLREKFATGDWNIRTIQLLVGQIRHHVLEISKEEFSELMEIPKSLLENYIYIKDYPTWQISNKSYFLKNLKRFNEEYFVKLSDRILKSDYDIDEMIETIDYIKNNFNILRKNHGKLIELPIRNIQETIKESSVINEEELKANGFKYAEIVDKVIKSKR